MCLNSMVVAKKKTDSNWLKSSLVRVAKIHFVFAIIYIAQIIAYDASKLVTPDVVLDRWISVALLAAVSAIVWYLARNKAQTTNSYKFMAWALIIADIAFAAFNVYTQRGMASRAVFLFVIPILVSAVLLSRVALFSTAVLASAAYTTAAIAYFVNYFNEGYKVELYGEILLYSALLFVIAGLLSTLLKFKPNS